MSQTKGNKVCLWVVHSFVTAILPVYLNIASDTAVNSLQQQQSDSHSKSHFDSVRKRNKMTS